MAVAARLPGIQFDVVAPPPSLPLVRMDIAVFVGFAASGPLHTPVAVEDIAHFEEIFGNDLLIANDPIANQQLYALMPSSVRAFFRNGGSRCWVIRVAAADEVLRLRIVALRVFGEDLGGLDRQGAVDVDRDLLELPRADQQVQAVDQVLGAPDREGGDDDFAAPADRTQDRLMKFPMGFHWVAVRLIPIGAFHHQEIRVVRQHRIAQDRHIVPADIPGEP